MQHHDHQMSSREVLLTKIPLFFHHLQQLAKTFHRIPDEWQPLASPSFEPTSLNIQSTFTPENSELVSMIAFSSSPGPLRYDSEPSKFLGSSHQKNIQKPHKNHTLRIHINPWSNPHNPHKYINPYTYIYIYTSPNLTPKQHISWLYPVYKSVYIQITNPLCQSLKPDPSSPQPERTTSWTFDASVPPRVSRETSVFFSMEKWHVLFITQKMLLNVMQYNTYTYFIYIALLYTYLWLLLYIYIYILVFREMDALTIPKLKFES